MNDSVDSEIVLDLQNLEDELKAAEQEYLQKIQNIVSKYTKRARELREQSLRQYEEMLNNKMQKIIQKEQSKESTRDIMMNSPNKPSGCTPMHVQKIRESLQRGQKLYEINRNKENIQNDNNINKEEQKEDNNDDDDLNIIALNSHKWSRKLQNNLIMNEMEESQDSTFVEIHKENISDNSSVSSLRHSSYFASNSKFKKQVMVNRLRRKRKYECIQNEDENMIKYEPPKKKTNIKSMNLMSSRDLKNELKRIRCKNKANTKLNRKKLLLTKSISNLSNKKIFNDDTESESDDDLLITKK